MPLQIQENQKESDESTKLISKFKDRVFSKDYVDYLNEAGWKLEKKFPSNSNYYSDLLEDTEWKSNYKNLKPTKHYRRDLDALS